MGLTFIITGALIIEILAIILRFGFNFNTKTIQQYFKLPIKIHTLYIGILIGIIGAMLKHNLILDIGVAIALSDVIHHLIVLPIINKKTDFP